MCQLFQNEHVLISIHIYNRCSYVKRKSKLDNENECGGLDDDEESGPDDENEYRLVESEHGD